MTRPRSSIQNRQKLSDIYDVFDPAVDSIIRDELRARPFANRRQWEFSIIYLALERAGFLKPNTRGLAMGAGTERLIYAIAPKVDKAVITDLYGMSGGWQGLDTPDPQELILAKAPWEIDPNRLEALPMDMRDLKFPDDSFDFCWSTGAIEHIGSDDDFIKHFNEVWRVLKPGGMYALTTACILGADTARIPNNYYFAPQHLLDLAHESRLQTLPVFDCHLREHSLNDAKIENLGEFGFPAGNHTSPLIALRRGCLVVGNSLILTKSSETKVRPVIEGLSETTDMAKRTAERLNKRTWKQWQPLTLIPQPGFLRSSFLWFGEKTVDVQLIGDFKRARVYARPLIDSEPKLLFETETPAFQFDASSDRIYVVHLDGASSNHTVLRARHGSKGDYQLILPRDEPHGLIDKIKRVFRNF